MKRILFAAIGALCLAFVSAPVSAYRGGHGGGGGAGSLDPTWGGKGYATTNFPGIFTFADGVAVGPGGSVVAVGGQWDGSDGDFAIARFNGDGSPDTSFGNGGRVMTDFKGGTDVATAVAVDGDRLVVVGYTTPNDGTFSFAMARYLKNGDLDPSFGNGGKVVSAFSDSDLAEAVVVRYGRILVAGSTATGGGDTNFIVARYNEDGSPDTSFNGTGRVVTDFNGGDDSAYAMIVVGARILVAGYARGAMMDFGLARYRWSGRLDKTFGNGGKVLTDFAGGDDVVRAVDVQRGGRIVAIGSASNANDRDFAAAMYDWRGNLNSRFGNGGRATMDLGKDDVAQGGGFGPGGTVTAGGYSADVVGTFAVVQWTASGLPDPRFGGGPGFATTAIGGDSSGYAMGRGADNKIVVAGFADNDIAVARYLDNGERRGRGRGH